MCELHTLRWLNGTVCFLSEEKKLPAINYLLVKKCHCIVAFCDEVCNKLPCETNCACRMNSYGFAWIRMTHDHV